MKNDYKGSLHLVLEWIGVVLVILLTIGFFNTPFNEGKATIMTAELLAEREYVETMSAALTKFGEQTVKINETNEQSQKGQIVPLKVSQIYAEIFKQMETDYNNLSLLEVPDRFKTFHTTFIKAMEIKGAALNEFITYLNDGEEAHLLSIQRYDAAFLTKYQDSVVLFNRLVEEKNLN